MDAILQKIKSIKDIIVNPLSEKDLKSKGLSSIHLRDYQLVGVNWLLSRISQNHGAILADEMGLGKTCQSIAFMLGLSAQNTTGPFLIVSPLAVMDNWRSELAKFAPSLEVIVYMGDKESRKELQVDAKKKKFNVFLTTYELALNDEEFLSQFNWKILIVDEGHRLKNKDSILHQMLSELKIGHRILLTGTPIQNNLAELFALLHFVAPKCFSWKHRDQFLEDFDDENNKDELHDILKPFILRRTKAEAVKDLPGKTEVILFHSITDLQKKYYKALLLKDRDAFGEKQKKTSLMNILVQLRKCVNHPYLFDGVEPEPFELGEHLVSASGKLALIDQLLNYLKPLGHRVLLFSQMTRMLDILQDYIALRGHSYERLDGSVRGEERFLAVKNFNDDDDTFVFLLSTKAGGQGLNLTGADTVIFVDSDFNPQNDLQAAARVHRIGQKRPVKIIRLLAQHTVEEIIVRRAHSKLKLTNQVIEGGQFALGIDKENILADSNIQLQDILKFGVHELFKTTDSDETARLDFVSILGESVNGEWCEKETAEAPPESMDTDSQGGVDAMDGSAQSEENHMYMFEGRDYSKEPSMEDQNSFDKMVKASETITQGDEYTLRRKGAAMPKSLTELSSGLISTRKPRPQLTPEELAARKKKREENLALRRQKEEADELEYLQKRKQKLLEKWHTNNYTSHSIDLSDSEEEESSEIDEGVLQSDESDSEAPTSRRRIDIRYVSGDVTHPQYAEVGDAIIGHCVDYSGVWSTRGIFAALSNRSPQPETVYTDAGRLRDLALGDVHLVPCDDVQKRAKGNDFVGLLVAQQRVRKSNACILKMLALDLCLRKLCKVARQKKASVHLPRIGHDDPKCNWYGVERLVRKRLSTQGVPVFVYYYPRRGRHRQQQGKDRPGHKRSIDDSSECQEGSSVSQSSEKKRVREEGGGTEGEASSTTFNSHQKMKGTKIKPTKKKLKDISDSEDSDDSNSREHESETTSHLLSILNGKSLYLHNVNDQNKMLRLIVAMDGEVSNHLSSSVTHVVAGPSGPPDSFPKSCIAVNESWIHDCFTRKICLPEIDYKV